MTTLLILIAVAAVEWLALLLAFRAGLVAGRRAGLRQARDWWAGKLDIERETGQRLLAAERRRCASRLRGERFRAEPLGLRYLRVDRNRVARNN